MVRAPSYDKNGTKKGAWSQEEDDKLRYYVLRYGHWNWREIPKYAGLKRCGKSCRLRWVNYLRPELKHGNYTEEEDALIMKLHEELGNRWSTIAASLPGRTDNEVKNHWHTVLKDRVKRNEYSSATTTSQSEATNYMIFESSPFSPTTYSCTHELFAFSSDAGSISSLNVGGGIENICFPPSLSSSEIYEAQSSGDFWSEPFVADNIYNLDDYASSIEKGGFGLPLPYDMCYGDDFSDFFYQLM